MKRLFLLRHAKSSWGDARLPDDERPLAKRGERDAPRIGNRLRTHFSVPSLIVTSSAARALRTAELVAHELGYPRDALVVEKALYLAAAEQILAVAARQDDGRVSVMLIGHNPGFTDLANRLLPELELDNVPTAGIVAMDAATDRWSMLAAASCRLAYYDYPKNPGPPRLA
jgi:phosphohistidine phosphatase